MESTLRGSVPAGTRLIETFGWTPEAGYRHLDRHFARMARSARYMGFEFDAAAAHGCLSAQGSQPLRCRLTLGAKGFEFTWADMAATPARWTVAISDQRLSSADPWLQHKTTRRALYDNARANLPDGVDEWVFLNEQNEVCEGTITNIFVTLANGAQITPPTSCGLLPGILREELLTLGQVKEGIVTRDMMRAAKAIHMGNSLRGLIKADLV
ncbi:MAG: aminotransferase class IV family protein [Cognatishimia sp.]|uniref:aminotransferase class IV family protein n=1 Tax=Cognatishimia sp. TaxID=2211648 RepID=UPI003B8E57E9